MIDDLSQAPSLKQLVYNSLRAKIINGELKPGARLLEEELSKSMNISRGPIREAFNMLERDGFMRIIPRRGAVVSEITVEEVEAIWEMRLLLEPYAAKQTLHLIPKEEIDEMEKKITSIGENPGDFEQYLNSDLELHDLLYKYLKNHLMRTTLENIRARSLRIRWEYEYSEDGVLIPEIIQFDKDEHQRIVCAMQSGNEQLVFQAVYDHINESSKRIVKCCRD